MQPPIFGKKEPTINYERRDGVYAVIEDQERQQLILVEAPNHAYFLPGGEIETGETQASALAREVMEELGFEITLGRYLGQADEYFHSTYRQKDYHNPGYFYQAKGWKKVGPPLETVNQLHWVKPEQALQLLKRGSHQWAVKQWLAQQNN